MLEYNVSIIPYFDLSLDVERLRSYIEEIIIMMVIIVVGEYIMTDTRSETRFDVHIKKYIRSIVGILYF